MSQRDRVVEAMAEFLRSTQAYLAVPERWEDPRDGELFGVVKLALDVVVRAYAAHDSDAALNSLTRALVAVVERHGLAIDPEDN